MFGRRAVHADAAHARCDGQWRGSRRLFAIWVVAVALRMAWYISVRVGLMIPSSWVTKCIPLFVFLVA